MVVEFKMKNFGYSALLTNYLQPNASKLKFTYCINYVKQEVHLCVVVIWVKLICH